MVYGQTQEAQQNKASGAPKRAWDLDSIYAELESHAGAAAVQGARNVKHWMDTNADEVLFGKGSKEGSVIAKIARGGSVFTPLHISTYGRLWIKFSSIRKPPFDSDQQRRELRRRINEIEGVNLPESAVDSEGTIPLTLLADDARFAKLSAALDWFVEELRSS